MLDLGCGAGVLTKALLDRRHTVVALDCSQGMLDKVQTSLATHDYNRGLRTVQELVTETKLPPATFDVVVCVGVIQYQVSENDILSEIARVLKYGGVCVFTMPNLLSLTHLTDPIYFFRALAHLWTRFILGSRHHARSAGLHSIVGENPTEAQIYNKKYVKWEIRKAFEQHGMVVHKLDGFGFGPITFRTKKVLPDVMSTWISERLTRLSVCAPWCWLSCFSNRWVGVAVKL